MYGDGNLKLKRGRTLPASTPQDIVHIRLRGVTMRYPMAPLQRRSIKADLIGLVRSRKDRPRTAEYVTALDNVTLNIEQGERVALIGRNGAGKSSFLRMVAGIYLPHSGVVDVKGCIQGIFDIGIGFESHASGRANIVYRGLVMGLEPDDIKSRVEAIIRFADIGEFIDMPLRSYSSGMVVRLAFAISTFLEGEILLIDEVFGAGDLAFYNKAKERMQEMVGEARIVCFASHDLVTVREICTRALWIHRGVVKLDGPVADVTKEYETAVVRGSI